MRIPKDQLPLKINIPGSSARQKTGFGDASEYGKLAGEYFVLARETDLAPLLKGLENDLCQSPHWGYQISGQVTVAYSDGSEETVQEGDLFYWPPGHTVRADSDSEFVLFSPQELHEPVVDHVKKQLNA